MEQTTGCLKKTGFLDVTKKRTLVGVFQRCRTKFHLLWTVFSFFDSRLLFLNKRFYLLTCFSA